MSEIAQPSESQISHSTVSPSNTKSAIGKKQKLAKPTHVKTTVRMLVDHDHALRLASVLLERAGEPVYTIQQMLDEAIARYTDYLQIKKGIDFQGIVPKKPIPAK